MPATKKKQRSLCHNALVGTLHLTDERGREVSFWIDRLDTDFGVGYRLTKLLPVAGESPEYDVLLSDDGKADVCGCKGHLRWGHRTVCRHVAALRCLRQRGLLA